jgi:hypothetical protein
VPGVVAASGFPDGNEDQRVNSGLGPFGSALSTYGSADRGGRGTWTKRLTDESLDLLGTDGLFNQKCRLWLLPVRRRSGNAVSIDRGQQHQSGGCAARVYHEAAEMPPSEAAVDCAGRSEQIGNLAGSAACEHRGHSHQPGC